jgi:hypothetical protein
MRTHTWLDEPAFDAAYRAARREAELDRTPLTDEDRQMLSYQIALSNVTVENGRAVRNWRTDSADYIADLDRAIGRLNTELASLIPSMRTTEELDAWLLGLPDPDTFTDDKVLAEAWYGWVTRDKWMPLLTFLVH